MANARAFRLSLAMLRNPQLQNAMGFDKDDTRPVVDVNRRTTKVNIWMAVSILVFFALAIVVVWALWNDPSSATTEAVPLP